MDLACSYKYIKFRFTLTIMQNVQIVFYLYDNNVYELQMKMHIAFCFVVVIMFFENCNRKTIKKELYLLIKYKKKINKMYFTLVENCLFHIVFSFLLFLVGNFNNTTEFMMLSGCLQL